MRRWNAVLSGVMLILLLLHGIPGAFTLMGMGYINVKVFTRMLMILLMIHVVLSVILMGKSMIAMKKTRVLYFKENLLFYVRRISGLAIMLLLGLHVTAIGYMEDNVYHLNEFTSARLLTQLLFWVAVAVHVMANVKPMFIALGIKKFWTKIGYVLFALSVVLLFMAVAFIVYYIRWNT